MGKARWWVCEDCKSLNDLPANKCYNCRAAKAASPSLIDDQYGVVGGETKRVGITVDLSQVADLTRRDPVETQKGGTIIETYGRQDEQSPDTSYPAGRTIDPAPRQPAVPPPPPPPPPPLREPTPRGISAVGGRDWTKDLAPLPPPPPTAAAPDVRPPAQVPPPGAPPPPGYAPPPPGNQGRPPMPPPPGTPMTPPPPPSPPPRESEAED